MKWKWIADHCIQYSDCDWVHSQWGWKLRTSTWYAHIREKKKWKKKSNNKVDEDEEEQQRSRKKKGAGRRRRWRKKYVNTVRQTFNSRMDKQQFQILYCVFFHMRFVRTHVAARVFRGIWHVCTYQWVFFVWFKRFWNLRHLHMTCTTAL